MDIRNKFLYTEMLKEITSLIEAKGFSVFSSGVYTFEEYVKNPMTLIITLLCAEDKVKKQLPYTSKMDYLELGDKLVTIQYYLYGEPVKEISPWDYNEEMLINLADLQHFAKELKEFDDYLEGEE